MVRAGEMIVSNSTFINNSAQGFKSNRGGAIYGGGTVFNSTFINNSMSGVNSSNSSAIYGISDFNVSDSTFDNNTDVNGFAIYNKDATMNLTNNKFSDSGGKDIYNDGVISSVVIKVLGNKTNIVEKGGATQLVADVIGGGGYVIGQNLYFISSNNGLLIGSSSLGNATYVNSFPVDNVDKRVFSAIYAGASYMDVYTGTLEYR